MSVMTSNMESLSIQQARKLVLLSQRVISEERAGSAINATLSAIEHLGYIQIDTISVIQRAHHHTLWNRNQRYKTSHLDELIADKKVFEYWSHAAAYLPMCCYRYSLPRKKEIASGNQNHWYRPNDGLMKEVLKRISSEGPLMAKDFEYGGEKQEEWTSKPSKQALEYLFMQGDLMIPYRKNFHKVYDLTERVIPANIDTTEPNEEEYARFLVTRYLLANGLGKLSEITYLLKNIKPIVSNAIQEMVLNRELFQIYVDGVVYFVLPNSLKLLNKPLSRKKLKILSPFDNLLIQRKRVQAIFDFDYQIECYVPKAKRKFGYFSLPVLWGGELVARVDCKVEREKSLLHIKHLALEASLTKIDPFFQAFCFELKEFMKFNNCNKLKIHNTMPTIYRSLLKGVVSDLNELTI